MPEMPIFLKIGGQIFLDIILFGGVGFAAYHIIKHPNEWCPWKWGELEDWEEDFEEDDED